MALTTAEQTNRYQVTHESNGFVRIKGKGFDGTFLNLSKAEIDSLCANPWQMFNPPRERVFVPETV